MEDSIDTQSIIDRVKNKAAPIEESPEEEATESPEEEATEDPADVHLGDAFEALRSGNKQGFIDAMKECLSSGSYA